MFADLLAHPGVEEVSVLRSRFGFMAYHGGGLEEMTDVIAGRAAALAGASYYGVHQPTGLEWHIPSVEVDPLHSAALSAFLDHVEVVVTVHGFGRQGYWTTLLLGGQNRDLAHHVAARVGPRLPAYELATDLERIPKELPPRVRGSSPLWWDWEGPEPTPHTVALIDGLAEAAASWA